MFLVSRLLQFFLPELLMDLVDHIFKFVSFTVFLLFTSSLQVLIFHFLCVPLTALFALVDGKSQEMSTTELFGGARIHYIFQSIFVKCLEVRIWSIFMGNFFTTSCHLCIILVSLMFYT